MGFLVHGLSGVAERTSVAGFMLTTEAMVSEFPEEGKSAEEKFPKAFEFGTGSFGVALIVFAVASYYKPLAGHPLRPLALRNIIIALFIIRWVFPKIPRSRRKLELAYFSLLIISNFFASTSNAAVFLGGSLWVMSDISIGLSTYVQTARPTASTRSASTILGFIFSPLGS